MSKNEIRSYRWFWSYNFNNDKYIVKGRVEEEIISSLCPCSGICHAFQKYILLKACIQRIYKD